MTAHENFDRRDLGGEGTRGLWLLAACCVPLIALFTLVALKVI